MIVGQKVLVRSTNQSEQTVYCTGLIEEIIGHGYKVKLKWRGTSTTEYLSRLKNYPTDIREARIKNGGVRFYKYFFEKEGKYTFYYFIDTSEVFNEDQFYKKFEDIASMRDEKLSLILS